jgi:hypothetical protein
MLVSAKRVIELMANLGGTAECLSAFRPMVDGRFLFVNYRCWVFETR